MSYCLNPHCQEPQNIDQIELCQSCGSKLLLKSRYRALQKIGQGGFGKTFLAVDEDKPSKPQCVIKQFLPQTQGVQILQKATELFEKEAVRLDELGKHAQIPELLAHFEQDGQLYLVQEFIDGQNLAEELARKGAFNEAKIRQLLTSLLPVLKFVHSHHVIHRDIKPGNIIRRSQDEQLVLVDFGAAKLVTETALHETGTVIGSLRYAAPEQAQGKAIFASDLYSLGVTCLYLLTNVNQFELFDTSENQWVWRKYVNTEISDSLGLILDNMVQMATKRRYQSANEVWQDLAQPNLALNTQPSPPLVTQPMPLKIGSSWGYIDQTGRVIIQPQFDWADGFAGDLAAVRIGRRWGYVDRTGEVVIQPQFEGVESFSAEGIAAVRMGEQWGYIDHRGKVICKPQFNEAMGFSDGMAAIKLGNKWGYIDQTGRVVIRAHFDEVRSFAEGLAWVKMPSKWLGILQHGSQWGCIDRTGKVVKESDFDEVYDLSEGMAAYRIGDKYGYIHPTGQVVIEPQFEINSFCLVPPSFSEGLAMVRINSKWGYIDLTGQVIIQPQFTQAGSFSLGLAAVKIGSKWGYIDQQGCLAIQPQFDQAYRFADSEAPSFHKSPALGLAMVRIEDNWHYIDRTGKFVGPSWRW
ncbi:WG repeat-containing protein [Lyngbya aestuarii]|uniref:WG repeat-containing protein n=1 Tax=Lyngbya aestuarii TaxID=118322 RepID=UPI00403E0538